VMAGWVWGGGAIVLLLLIGQVYLESVTRR
jgi:hypothetical protein